MTDRTGKVAPTPPSVAQSGQGGQQLRDLGRVGDRARDLRAEQNPEAAPKAMGVMQENHLPRGGGECKRG